MFHLKKKKKEIGGKKLLIHPIENQLGTRAIIFSFK